MGLKHPALPLFKEESKDKAKPMSTALAVVNQTDIMTSMGFSEGEPIKPVNLNLIQPINASADEGTIAGRFCDSQSNMQFESLDVVVLEVRNGRVYFAPGGDLGQKPVCRSNDGKMPVIADNLVRQDDGRGCAKCPMSQWKQIAGKKIKPACQDTRTVLLAEVSTGFTYRLNAKGMSLGPVDDLRETIRKFYLRSKAGGKAVMPYQMVFKMSSLKIKGQKGTYYVPKFSPPSLVADDRSEEFLNLYQRLVLNKGVDYEDTQAPPKDAVSSVLEGEYEPQQFEAA